MKRPADKPERQFRATFAFDFSADSREHAEELIDDLVRRWTNPGDLAYSGRRNATTKLVELK